MMDLIEAQITVAIDGVSIDTDGRSDDPTAEPRPESSCSKPLSRLGDSQGRPASRRVRPGTGDSARTGMTTMTVESTAMSIAGMGRRSAHVPRKPLQPARQTPQAGLLAVDVGTSSEESGGKGDDIAARIAQIAQKVRRWHLAQGCDASGLRVTV